MGSDRIQGAMASIAILGGSRIVPQCDQGVDSGSAIRRNKRCNGNTQDKSESGNCGIPHIHRIYSEQLIRDQMLSDEREGNADENSCDSLSQGLAQYHSDDLAAVRSESDPYTDLTRSPLNDIRHQSVQADTGEYEGKHGEEHSENRDHGFLAKRPQNIVR